MTYTWEILKLGTLDQTNAAGEDLADAIVSIKWRKIATNADNKTASYVSSTKLSVADISAADFVALDDVTKAIVVGWIEESLSTSDTAAINKILANKVEQNTMTEIVPSW
tara:strand:+ start:2701 stop:3030 length:330 start_codon:yes stop_codon:yes gene_type:complete